METPASSPDQALMILILRTVLPRISQEKVASAVKCRKGTVGRVERWFESQLSYPDAVAFVRDDFVERVVARADWLDPSLPQETRAKAAKITGDDILRRWRSDYGPQMGHVKSDDANTAEVKECDENDPSKVSLNGQDLPISADQIRQGAENFLKTACVGQGEPRRLSKDEVKKLAEDFGLLKATRTNPHLRFLGGDISFWYEQELSEDELKLEFAARKIVLEAAGKQGVVIDDQGKLSWAAQRIMADILKARAALA